MYICDPSSLPVCVCLDTAILCGMMVSCPWGTKSYDSGRCMSSWLWWILSPSSSLPTCLSFFCFPFLSSFFSFLFPFLLSFFLLLSPLPPSPQAQQQQQRRVAIVTTVRENGQWANRTPQNPALGWQLRLRPHDAWRARLGSGSWLRPCPLALLFKLWSRQVTSLLPPSVPHPLRFTTLQPIRNKDLLCKIPSLHVIVFLHYVLCFYYTSILVLVRLCAHYFVFCIFILMLLLLTILSTSHLEDIWNNTHISPCAYQY